MHEYKIGDTANGHTLTEWGWVPTTEAAPQPVAKKKVHPLVGFAALGVSGLLVFAACSSGSGSTSSTDSDSTSAATTSTDESVEEPAGYVADVDDWKVTLKTVDKQCFGSAGCNVEVKPSLKYVGSASLPDEGLLSITFRVSGDESGPVIETIEADLSDDGTYSYSTVYMSTSSGSVEPKAKVTDVEYTNF